MSLLLFVACAAEPAVEQAGAATPWPCGGEPVVTWDNFGHGFVLGYCQGCHDAATPTPNGAPATEDFGSFAAFSARADAVRARVLDAGDMPPGGGVTADDKARLDVLLRCGL